MFIIRKYKQYQINNMMQSIGGLDGLGDLGGLGGMGMNQLANWSNFK